ncbi:DNA polymerase I [Streptomyces tendae]
MELIGELLDSMHVPRFAVEGFEADDVIATLATQAKAEGFDVLIVTGDRDSFQLVSEHTTVLYPTKGVSELTHFTPEKVFEKYGLTPAQYPDFAALRGDPSDNLPGIPASARRPPRSGSTSSGPSRSWSSASTRSRARPGRTSATTWSPSS